ncbi:uncharacterized protein LOC132205188 [Neocloeon triangulifer]|uniref:uncharacterized protein LOC132205188 n=1 Tax=Neocloeon triangulifer TaxID=2078957 RepID=UPI00286ED306|nr:uncharacterized protein LOC132205188 [Neocloeon triangulifer]
MRTATTVIFLAVTLVVICTNTSAEPEPKKILEEKKAVSAGNFKNIKNSGNVEGKTKSTPGINSKLGGKAKKVRRVGARNPNISTTRTTSTTTPASVPVDGAEKPIDSKPPVEQPAPAK